MSDHYKFVSVTVDEVCKMLRAPVRWCAIPILITTLCVSTNCRGTWLLTHCALQVIQQDSFQQQQQQQQQQPQPHTIPINIITPVNVQQPAPPPQPPPQAAQPTQIQIILPQSSFPAQPVALNPGVGSTQPQRQIILQVQDPAPPLPPPPPPPAPPPQPVVAVQETPVQAVMQGGRVVSLPPSVLQSILEQLQGGGRCMSFCFECSEFHLDVVWLCVCVCVGVLVCVCVCVCVCVGGCACVPVLHTLSL